MYAHTHTHTHTHPHPPYLDELSAHNLLYQLLLAAGEEGDVGGGEGGREALQGGRGCRVDRRTCKNVISMAGVGEGVAL